MLLLLRFSKIKHSAAVKRLGITVSILSLSAATLAAPRPNMLLALADDWSYGRETGYMDTDGSPTKTEVLGSRAKQPSARYWELSFGKRTDEELYDLKRINQSDFERPNGLPEASGVP